MRRVYLWTDGGCRKMPNKGVLHHIGAGIVAECEGYRQEWAEPLGTGTNQQAELLAIFEALGKLEDRANLWVTVTTDSQYCRGCLTLNWNPKYNIPLIQAVKTRMKEFGRVTIHWVKGHDKDENNNRADHLAGIACGRIRDDRSSSA